MNNLKFNEQFYSFLKIILNANIKMSKIIFKYMKTNTFTEIL